MQNSERAFCKEKGGTILAIMQDVKALGLRTKCFVNSLAYGLFYQPQIKTPLEKKILSFKNV